ncbi:MAG TPA: 50S ribosomal protein L22 [Armatimonadota bacterium]|nr:50S ribosomal protein L22 [Armatimonadota bacterium]
MEAKATAKYIRIAPFKVRRVLALIRGQDLTRALALLDFTPGMAAPAIKKVLSSAAANAETNHGMNRERLRVRLAYADAGPSLRRFRPGSLSRGGIIRKRMSHITVVLDERPQPAAAPKRRPPARMRPQ